MISSDGGIATVGAPGGSTEGVHDWARLERAIRALVAEQGRLRQECRSLRQELDARGERVRRLEEQLLEANQRRQDTAKRLDELISQLDRLDDQLASAEPAE